MKSDSFLKKIKGYVKENRNMVLFHAVRIGLIVIALAAVVSTILLTTGKKRDQPAEAVTGEQPPEEKIEEEDEIPAEPQTQTLSKEDLSEDEDDPEIGQASDGEDLEVEIEKWITSMSQYEEEGTSYGIDVAKYQGIIDWQQVADAGIDYAMIRVGYRTQSTGVICEDSLAKYNLQEAIAAGLQVGVYFFSTAINEEEAREEAQWVLDLISRYPITYPVAYNCEGFHDAANRQYGMTKDERSQMAIAFLDEIAKNDYTPMFYASKSELTNSSDWNTEDLAGRYRIWLAYYPRNGVTTSGYEGEHAMWQYSNRGNISGISGSVDVNVAYFSYTQAAEAKSQTAPDRVEANLASLVEFTSVDEQVTAKETTNLRNEPSSRNADTIVAAIQNGEFVLRTGIGSNGWSRLDYNGQTVYAITSYLTTEAGNQGDSLEETTVKEDTQQEVQQPATFTETAADGSLITFRIVNETITSKDVTNLRSLPSTEAGEVVTTLSFGQNASRIGIGDNGWSKLQYGEQTLYAMTKYLTTDLNYKANVTPTLENPEGNMIFKEAGDRVTAKIEVNLRSVASQAEGDATVVAKLKAGEVLDRTGIAQEQGWSRLNYNGQTVYAVTSYLSVVE